MSASAKNRAPWLVLLQKVLIFAGEKRFPEIGREAAMAAVQRHRVRLSGNRVRVPDSPAAVSLHTDFGKNHTETA